MSCHQTVEGGDPPLQRKLDILLWGSLSGILILYSLASLFDVESLQIGWLSLASFAVYDLVNTMWWGILFGIVMVAILTKIPREFVIAVLGPNCGFAGIFRAAFAGVLLDLCNHGVLMVAAKLYERGASAGQVIAFLVASPWNSFSLTFVLIALIGIKWTVVFIVLSFLIAIVAGALFDNLVRRRVLPVNPNKTDLPKDFKFWEAAYDGIKQTSFSLPFFKSMITSGVMESRMVLRWIFFGIVLAALIRAFVDAQSLESYFGPTFMGLLFTMLVATILEVCSEGSTPVAADLLTRAGAPGNSFAFLMTGVATDYTEIMILKEVSKSWRFSLFLPAVTLPQVLVISAILNSTV